VFAPRFIAGAILRPCGGVAAYLPGYPLDHRVRHGHVAGQNVSRITQQAKLNGEADPVGVTAALPDQGQIELRKTVMPDQIVLLFW